jgi:RND family efflux transporter MFP subunit
VGGLVLVPLLVPAWAGLTPRAAEAVEGFSQPFLEVQVAAPESGIIETILVKQGQAVRRGQVLATLDQSVLRTSLEFARAKARATAARDAARAELALRQSRLEKLLSLRAEGHSSREEVERTQTDVQIAQARLRAAEEEWELNQLEVRRIEAQLARLAIVSPTDGVVVRLHREAGEFVAANAPQVATVVRLDALRVKLYPPTDLAGHLSTAQSVPLVFPETGQHAEGRVEFISPTTDADSGTVRVELIIDNADGRYRSGVPVRIERLRD